MPTYPARLYVEELGKSNDETHGAITSWILNDGPTRNRKIINLPTGKYGPLRNRLMQDIIRTMGMDIERLESQILEWSYEDDDSYRACIGARLDNPHGTITLPENHSVVTRKESLHGYFESYCQLISFSSQSMAINISEGVAMCVANKIPDGFIILANMPETVASLPAGTPLSDLLDLSSFTSLKHKIKRFERHHVFNICLLHLMPAED